MSLIHEKIYTSMDLEKIDFGDYVSTLTQHLLKAYGINPADISIQVDVDDESLGIETATSCGLIINELVSNALKHAFPRGNKGTVDVRLQRADNGTMNLVVADNGVGLPPQIDVENTHTLGLQIVTMLTEQLNGMLHVARDMGTSFTISFKEET